MGISLEALAMAGVDYNEWGSDIEKWEAGDEPEWPPPHLLAEEEEEEEEEEAEELEMGAKHGFQMTGTGSPTHSFEGFDGDSKGRIASNGVTLECRHSTSRGRALVEMIIQCLGSTNLKVRYIVALLMIASHVRRK